jgi:hypothetical protein
MHGTPQPTAPDIVLNEDVLQACMAYRRMHNDEGILPAYRACKDSAKLADARDWSRCLQMLSDTGLSPFAAAAWCKEHEPAEHPPPPPTATTAASPPTIMYQKGLADRTAWEHWIASLTGDYRTGAEYWASQRSLPKPGSCSGVPDFKTGCNAAKAKLAPVDILRRTEPEYKQGWNSYSGALKFDGRPPH